MAHSMSCTSQQLTAGCLGSLHVAEPDSAAAEGMRHSRRFMQRCCLALSGTPGHKVIHNESTMPAHQTKGAVLT